MEEIKSPVYHRYKSRIKRKASRKLAPVLVPLSEAYNLGRAAINHLYWRWRRSSGRIPFDMAAPFALEPASTAGLPKKNVIWVMLDALRQDIFEEFLRRGGLSDYFDRGAYFPRAFSQGSWTYPSIFSFLTGVFPFNSGTTKLVREDENLYSLCDDFDGNCPTVFSILRDNGYKVGSILDGWGLTVRKTAGQAHREDRYFEENWGWFYGQGRRFLTLDELSSVSRDYILESAAQGPFMLFVRSMYTHSPYRGLFNSAKYVNGLSRRRWAFRLMDGFIRGLQHFEAAYFKPLLAALREAGQLDNTLIIICSDHGDMFWNVEDDLRSEVVNDEVWRHQLEPYNALIKVPLFIWGGQMKGVYPDRFRLVDVLPTLIEELGIDYDTSSFDGISVRRTAPRPLYADSAGYGHSAVSFQDTGAKLLISKRLGKVAYKITEDEYEQLDLRIEADNRLEKLEEFLEQVNRYPLIETAPESDDALTRRLRALGYID